MQDIANENNYSRWSTEEEITSFLHEINLEENIPHPGGIPLFADSESVYIDPTDSHSLVVGSTGSKKTRLISMPALQLYAKAGESFIATDPKAELYERTFPLLKEQGYNIFVLNLRDPQKSNCWNPLAVPYNLYRKGQRDKATELLSDMANCIVKQNYSYKEPYWINSAANMLTGLLLILFECAQKDEINFKSLSALKTEAFKIFNKNNKSENNAPFIRENFLKHLKTGSFVNSLLSGTADVCDTTRGCIVSEFDQALEPFFSQDNLINLLSGNDLDTAKIGKQKTAVFLIVPDENTIYHFLVSIFIKQCYTQLILEAQKQPNKALPRRVNFLLDEFASMPPIADFPAMITASRSRGIRFCLIVQSIKQLEAKYGIYAESIKGNCENWIVLHSREREFLNEIIELCGKISEHEPLVSMTLLQTLDKNKGEAFVLHKRHYPFIAKLPDINRYHDIETNKIKPRYPVNKRKADKVFDFHDFCLKYGKKLISKLFSDKSFEEIKNKCYENDEGYYMADEEMIYEPVFTSKLPEEPEPANSSSENTAEFPMKIPSDSTLEKQAVLQNPIPAISLFKNKKIYKNHLKRKNKKR
jgi:type IV secretion system protein VirD4